MKIGFISDDYHPRIDGVIAYIDTMSQALRELGHEVYIVCPKYPGHQVSEGNVVRVSSYDPLPFSKLTSRMMITNKKTLQQIEDLDLDIIHAHTQAGANFAAYTVAKQTNLKLLTTMHTTYHPLIDVYPWTMLTAVWMGNFLAWRYYKDIKAFLSLLVIPVPLKKKIAIWTNSYIKSVLDNSDLIITNSPHTKKYVESFGSQTKIEIVHNGIDRSKFKATKKSIDGTKSFNFVLTSRLSGEKRQEVAIKAVAKLINEGYDCHLTLVGGGPNRQKNEELIGKLRINECVTITGEVEQAEVKAALQEADAGLFTSYHFDTDPLAVMEYLSMGLPVIYCDENFDDMFIPGAALKCGKDYEAFAEAMKETMSDNKKLEEMRVLAEESSSKHDILDRAKELEKLYKNVVES